MSTLKNDVTPIELRTTAPKATVSRIVTILQAGFYRKSHQGTTLCSFLSTLPGFSSEYITDRLQTIFLNGDPVDDLELTFSEPEATLALSAAMPGLAGSLFRKSTILTPLRKQAVQQQPRDYGAAVVVKVKLFNVIGVEKGSGLLAEGVVLNGKDLYSFLVLRPKITDAIQASTLNGQPISGQALLSQVKICPKLLFICTTIDA